MPTNFLYQPQRVTPFVDIMEPLDVKIVEDQPITKINFDDDADDNDDNGNDDQRLLFQQQQQQDEQAVTTNTIQKPTTMNNESSSSTSNRTSTTTTNNEKKINKKKKTVRFSTVEIREYARCLGDNPSSTSDGPSLSIDWMYNITNEFSVTEYEEKQNYRKQLYGGLEKFPLNGKYRSLVIQTHTNCTQDDILQHIQQLDEIRYQREVSKRLPCLDGFRLLFETWERKHYEEHY